MKAYLLRVIRALLVAVVSVAIVRALYYVFDWDLDVWVLAAWVLFVVEMRFSEVAS